MGASLALYALGGAIKENQQAHAKCEAEAAGEKVAKFNARVD